MRLDILRIIWFITSSLNLEKKFSNFGVKEKNITISQSSFSLGPKIISILGSFEKLRPPSISQERERLGHQDNIEKYVPTPKEPSEGKKSGRSTKSHFLRDYEKTVVTPEEKVSKQEIAKPSKPIDVKPETILDSELETSFSMEDVKTHVQEQADEKLKLSTFNKKTIEGIELPKPLLLMGPEKINTIVSSLSKEKKILLLASGTVITFFVIDKLLDKNVNYKTKKQKLLKKVADLFKQFLNKLPRT